MSATNKDTLSADVWGGLAAMLVALPSAIAFGVAIYAPLGAESAAIGAMAGMVGAVLLGVINPLLGGQSVLRHDRPTFLGTGGRSSITAVHCARHASSA